MLGVRADRSELGPWPCSKEEANESADRLDLRYFPAIKFHHAVSGRHQRGPRWLSIFPPNLVQSAQQVAANIPASAPQQANKVIRDSLVDNINARLAEKNQSSQG